MRWKPSGCSAWPTGGWARRAIWRATTYTIADIAAVTWLGALVRGDAYDDAKTFLCLHEYTNVNRWVAEIDARPAVQRGRMVNRATGPLEGQLRERHDAADFATRTQDKLEPAEAAAS